MGVRRYSCFLLLIGVCVYALGALFYFAGKGSSFITKPPNFWDSMNDYHLRIERFMSSHDSGFAKQPSSYIIDPPDLPYRMEVKLPEATNTTQRQAAAFIVLVRNSELPGMLQSMHDVGKIVYYCIEVALINSLL
jgi:alpha 1,2-mannosyltransferase